LSSEALPAFLKDLEDYNGYVISKLALKLLVLTFVRPGGLRGAQWKEIDLNRRARVSERRPGEKVIAVAIT
jgi:integrase